MGPRQKRSPKLFYSEFNLEDRIPQDHIFRKILSTVDFGFVRPLVKSFYGKNGNASIDPVVALKLMFILTYEKVKSERVLMSQLPMRLDWLWFCGYDIDDADFPDHSVLSKTRRLWGKEIFREFFDRILRRCVEAGLVDGSVVHADSSMIDGNASKDKLKVCLRIAADKEYERLERCEQTNLDAPEQFQAGVEDEGFAVKKEESQSYVECLKTPESVASKESDVSGDETSSAKSPPLPRLGQKVTSVDPDARVGKKYGKSTLGYKDHRVVDDRCGIITATVVTPANVNDDCVLTSILDAHESNTASKIRTVVADKIYGTGENYKELHDRGITACIPHKQKNCNCDQDFANDRFTYDAAKDEYICPSGKRLSRRQVANDKNAVIYEASREDCAACEHFKRCVSSKTSGRQMSRNFNQDYIDWADRCLTRINRKRLMSRRKAKVEGSFADAANNHGFKRARWRGLDKMTIQNHLIATVQNLRKLLHATGSRGKSTIQYVLKTAKKLSSSLKFCVNSHFFSFENCNDKKFDLDKILNEPAINKLLKHV
ncbi:MAG: IS1182 family transposase [bacterium]|nr:IS1182 family transposase [bacterium]